MAVKAGRPCWADGLRCPDLDGLDPVEEARKLQVSVSEAVGRGGITVCVVDDVFALVQLALDDRSPDRQVSSSPAQKAFRSALARGALGLVTKLAVALQPEDGVDDSGKQGSARSSGGLMAAVVLMAGHLGAMERLVARQNNTSALLMAYNGLAKLLKGRWPWLIGGVLDAPRMLSQLCVIYRDGLNHLQLALTEASAKRAESLVGGLRTGSAAGVGETAHLKKFGKLLGTFGARMACLLRYLGPECSVEERRQAYRLLAKAAAAVYPGFVTLRAQEGNSEGSSALSGVVAGLVYPRTTEAFLSTAGPPPCFQRGGGSGGGGDGGGGRAVEGAKKVAAGAPVPGAAEPGDARVGAGRKSNSGSGDVAGGAWLGEGREEGCGCRCYEGGPSEGGGAGEKTSALERRGRHDPWEALEALRPKEHVLADSSGGRTTGLGEVDKDGGGDGGGNAEAGAADAVGAVLLLCEALRSEGVLSESVTSRLSECCGWVLSHLAALFPGWVESASAAAMQTGDARAPMEEARQEQLDLAVALCDEAATALGAFVSRRALSGEFDEAQMLLLEGCACHPHPLCREVWCNALIAFLLRCDATAQASCVQTFTDAALDPSVSPQCRRRLTRALVAISAASTAATLLAPACARLRQACLSRLQGQSNNDGCATSAAADCTSPAIGDACILELLGGMFSYSSVMSGDENIALDSSGAAFARTAVLAGLQNAAAGPGRTPGTAAGGGSRSNSASDSVETFAAAVSFLAAGLETEVGVRKVGRSGEGRSLVALEGVAKEAGNKLGVALARGELGAMIGRSAAALAATTRLVAKTVPGRLPQMCAMVIEEAGEGRLAAGGQELLALAEGLSCLGRQPLPPSEADASVRKAVLTDGFSALFGADLWPVTTAAMQALEILARHADPRIAALLPRLVPEDRLAAFKARLARRSVSLDGSRPLDLEIVREQGLAEWRTLAAAALERDSRTQERGSRTSLLGGRHQVVLSEGGSLGALSGLLSSTIVGIKPLSGRRICITLEKAEK